MSWKLYEGDCFDYLPEIEDHSVDMILCDLPYGTTACKWDTPLPLDQLWEEYKRIIKDNGAIVLTGSQPFTSKLVMSNPKMFRYEWIWEKESGTNFLSVKKNPFKVHENVLVFYFDKSQIVGRSEKFRGLRDYFLSEKEKSGLSSKEFDKLLGNIMSSRHYFTHDAQWSLPTKENYIKLQKTGFFKERYDKLHEIYLDLLKDCEITYYPQFMEGKPYSKTGNIAKSGVYGNYRAHGGVNNDGKRYPRTILRFNREKGLHPTQKPVPLFEYLIKTYTNLGELVLDNCAGSGTTGVAAENTGRNSILMEKEPEYCQIIKDRLAELNIEEQTQGQKVLTAF